MTGRAWSQGDSERRVCKGGGSGEKCLEAGLTAGGTCKWLRGSGCWSGCGFSQLHRFADGLCLWMEGSKWASWGFPGDLSIETILHLRIPPCSGNLKSVTVAAVFILF